MRPIALVLLLVVGCSSGPRRAAVSGTIVVDGSPLERGVITFIPTDGNVGPGTGTPVANGGYKLDSRTGPVIGANRIEIRGFRKTGRAHTVQGTAQEEEIQVVPPEYNDRSTVVRTIEPGTNQLDFDIVGVQK